MALHPYERGFPREPESYRDQLMHDTGPQAPVPVRRLLSVGDVERLAKAGVAIKFDEICHQVCPDDPPEPQLFNCNKLLRPLVDRWMAMQRATAKNPFDGMAFPFHLSASVVEQTVHVFVSDGVNKPVILEDDLQLYPSDALIAKLHLFRQTQKKQSSYNVGSQSFPDADQAASSRPR